MPVSRPPRFVPFCLVLVGLATLGGSGCAAARPSLIALTTRPQSNSSQDAGAIIFVVDGAGDFQGCSQHVREAVESEHLAIPVVTAQWSHGYGQILADQIGYAYARAQGGNLAQMLLQYRHEHPTAAIHLVGHSAGSAVAIAALENLPADVVDRAFLLAPSLSATYDIRPALQKVKDGLYVFYSKRDTAYLGIWTGILGNSDRRWGASSGRIGFQTACTNADDAVLYQKLHQRPWQPADRAAGNDGRHYGDHHPDFVRLHILPLVATPPKASPTSGLPPAT
jgi:pimeloyl-ACP methyl ester carboxylesterase